MTSAEKAPITRPMRDCLLALLAKAEDTDRIHDRAEIQVSNRTRLPNCVHAMTADKLIDAGLVKTRYRLGGWSRSIWLTREGERLAERLRR